MEEEQKGIQQNITGDYHATSMYGDASLHVHPSPVSSILPERVWMVPYRRNTFFTGREGQLEGLHEAFMKDRAAVLTQGQAINGLGGIGKTQIAVEYAYRHQEEYRFILWASAASQEMLLAAYTNIAERLQLPERYVQDQNKIVTAVVHWLATHEGWLLVVDNADEVDMIWPMLPTGSMGHLLLTTRDQVVGDMEPFEVKPMDRAEGTLFLLCRARVLKAGMELEQISPADRDIAEQIAAEMDGLPLALDQAGAYIEETACSLDDYLEAYRQCRSTFLADRGRMASDYPASVATTWVLSFERVEEHNPAAADLLRVCAFLAPDAIPEELILKGAKHLGPRLSCLAFEPLLLQKMIRTLRAYSLIRRDVKEKTLNVHRLVQTVLQDMLKEAEKNLWAEQVILAVDAAFPKVEHSSWLQCERMLPQAVASAYLIEQYPLINEEPELLLSRAAHYLYERARYAEAEPLYQRFLQIRAQQFGSEYSNAYSLTTLASIYSAQGKYVEAEPLYQRALHILEQQLGPKHPKIASPLNNLANLYCRQGKYAEAEPLNQRVLHILNQPIGLGHPLVASLLNNLATFYYERGNYAQAEPLYQRALYIWEQQLGLEHPDVAYSLDGLANLYSAQGKYAEAEPLYQRALHVWEQQLGLEHPDVASPLNNLAILYREQGKYAEAELLYQRALYIWEQQLGPEHPDVTSPLNNLANLYCQQGKYAEAEPLYQRALHVWEQQLGLEHPDVASSLNGLANLYCRQGKYAEAEPLYQRAFHTWELQMGPEHPDVAYSLNGLANLYCQQGKYAEAEPLYQRALHVREQALGAHHPQTMETRTSFIALLLALEQHEKAAQLEIAQFEPGTMQDG